MPRAFASTIRLPQLIPASATAVFAAILTYRLIACQKFHFSGLSQTVKSGSLAVVRVLSGPEQASGRYGLPDKLAEQTKA